MSGYDVNSDNSSFSKYGAVVVKEAFLTMLFFFKKGVPLKFITTLLHSFE